MNDLATLNDQLLPNDEQVGVPFDQSWSVGISLELRGPCDTAGCTARPVVVARLGCGAGYYCETCWRDEVLVRFLSEIELLNNRGYQSR
jgi:hypothetical protein